MKNTKTKNGAAIPPPLLDAFAETLKTYDHGTMEYICGDAVPFPAAIGLTRPLVAIADVHAHSAALAVLLREVMESHPDASINFLGDLINRGPDIPGALALAISTCLSLTDDAAGRTGIFHLGNHEEMFLTVLDALQADPCRRDPVLSKSVMKFMKFIKENRTWENIHLDDSNPADAIQNEIMSRIPDTLHPLLELAGGLIPWLLKQPVASRVGNLVFVHGGIAPTPKAEFDPVGWASDYLVLESDDYNTGPRWIREGFMDRREPFPGGYVVVHGHTIFERYVEAIRKGRIASIDPSAPTLGLDSGSFRTGVITAAIFQDGTVTLAHVRFDPEAGLLPMPDVAGMEKA